MIIINFKSSFLFIFLDKPYLYIRFMIDVSCIQLEGFGIFLSKILL